MARGLRSGCGGGRKVSAPSPWPLLAFASRLHAPCFLSHEPLTEVLSDSAPHADSALETRGPQGFSEGDCRAQDGISRTGIGPCTTAEGIQEGVGQCGFPSVYGSHPECRQSGPHRPQAWRRPFQMLLAVHLFLAHHPLILVWCGLLLFFVRKKCFKRKESPGWPWSIVGAGPISKYLGDLGYPHCSEGEVKA